MFHYENNYDPKYQYEPNTIKILKKADEQLFEPIVAKYYVSIQESR